MEDISPNAKSTVDVLQSATSTTIPITSTSNLDVVAFRNQFFKILIASLVTGVLQTVLTVLVYRPKIVERSFTVFKCTSEGWAPLSCALYGLLLFIALYLFACLVILIVTFKIFKIRQPIVSAFLTVLILGTLARVTQFIDSTALVVIAGGILLTAGAAATAYATVAKDNKKVTIAVVGLCVVFRLVSYL